MQDLNVKSTYCGENNRFGEVIYYQFISIQFITARVFNKHIFMILQDNFNYL